MQPTREKEETLSTPAPPHMHTSIKPISSATATSLGLSVMCQQVSKTFVTNRDWWTLSPIYLYYNDRHTHTRSVFFSCICTHTQTLAWIKKTSLVEVMSNSLVCQSEWERLGRKCQTEREVGNSLSDHVMPSCDFGETVSQERTSIFSVRLGIHGPQHRVTGAGGGGLQCTVTWAKLELSVTHAWLRSHRCHCLQLTFFFFSSSLTHHPPSISTCPPSLQPDR